MDDEQFEEWFYDNVDEMVDNGIMHPKSQAAKWVKLALSASLSHYESALAELDNRIRLLEGLPPKPEKIKEPVVIPKKKQPVKENKPKAKPEVKQVVSKQQWL
jgi:hypothetical protein